MTHKITKGKITISEKMLIKNGYKKYPANKSYNGDHTLFQKRIENKKGIKYFINIKKIEWRQPQSMHTMYDIDMQLITQNGAVNFTLVQWFNDDGKHSGNTIADVEKYFEFIFKMHGEPYYEKTEWPNDICTK